MSVEPREAALFSVCDRTGVVELARLLAERGTPIYATGGTCAHLREHGIDAQIVDWVEVARSIQGGEPTR